MFAIPGIREFRLSDTDGHGVSCGARGVFVGDIPLLRSLRSSDGSKTWSVRSEEELSDELTARYGLPVDVAAKGGGLATIAKALNRGELALARIATVQMQFPDPPPLMKGIGSPDDVVRLAAELYWSGLLKGNDWDEKHPRTGTKPNRGWFALVPKEPTLPKPGWPSKPVNTAIRETVEKIAAKLAPLALGPIGDAVFIATEIADAIEVIKRTFTIGELNQGEDRMIAQMKANFDPPKTFEELQKQPTENVLGYERHHIVEQNDDNIAKTDLAAWHVIEKFGREKIEDPSNNVWIPRLKHEKITTDYNSTDDKDPQKRRRREVVNDMDFEAQREEGLKKLREKGVLK